MTSAPAKHSDRQWRPYSDGSKDMSKSEHNIVNGPHQNMECAHCGEDVVDLYDPNCMSFTPPNCNLKWLGLPRVGSVSARIAEQEARP